jgi:DnaJ-class molecular chaperone
MAKKKTLYEDLAVDKDAPPETIKKAFRKKAKETHPDKGGDPEQFKAVVRAYSILSDEEKRKRYNNGENPDILDQPDIQQQQVLNMIFTLLNSVVEDPNFDFIHYNLFDILRENLKANRQNSKTEKNKMKNNIQRFENILKRIKKKDKAEPFIQFVDQKIKDCNNAIIKIESHIKLCEEALNLVEGCEYESDPVRQYSFIFSSGTTSTA